jgi:arylsulfatase A-like enzyme
MNLQPGNVTGDLPESTVLLAAKESDQARAGTATILAVATWIGLIAGFLDLGLLVIIRGLINQDFYRLGGDFLWIIPAGVTTLVIVPAIVLALYARMRGKSVRLGTAVGLLSFVGFLDVTARSPLDAWAALLLCAGLAVQSARLVERRGPGFRRLVRATVPVLAGAFLLIMLGTIGGRAWSERQTGKSLPAAPAGARNVLLIVWDTVRAGNLSLHGYRRRTTPNLEGLAGRGVRFDLAFATSSWTLPSHASLFTGRWPHELGVDWTAPLRSNVPTLAGYLAAHAYDTAGFAANLDYCGRETGLARGFAHYEDFPFDVSEVFTRYVALSNRMEISGWICLVGRLLERCTGRSYERIIPRAIQHAKNAEEVDHAFLGWLSRRQERHRPFFAFLNYNDAHTPYEVPDRSLPAFGVRPASCLDRLALLGWHTADKSKLSYHEVQMANDVYDDCIAYLDRRLGILLAELGRRGVLDDTIVIVTSDHGEHLGDHLLFFHGCSLYRQLVQVPLVIVDPSGAQNRVVGEPVSLRDIPATVVDLLGLTGTPPFPGRSLAGFSSRLAQRSVVPPPPLLMETGKPLLLTNQGREPAAKGALRGVVAAGLHYIREADGFEALYLLSDTEERINHAGAPNAQPSLRQLRDALRAIFQPKFAVVRQDR